MYVRLARGSLLLLLGSVMTSRPVRGVRVASVTVAVDAPLAMLTVPFETVLTGSGLRPVTVIVLGPVVVHLRVLYVTDTFRVRRLLWLLLLVLFLLLLMAT